MLRNNIFSNPSIIIFHFVLEQFYEPPKKFQNNQLKQIYNKTILIESKNRILRLKRKVLGLVSMCC